MRPSLFELKDLEANVSEEEQVFAIDQVNAVNYFRNGKNRKELVKAVGTLEEGKSTYTFSSGKWSSHELLAYVLEQTGPADVWITTWSCTEEPLRMLVKMKQNGMIRNMRCLFGDRVPVMSPNAWQLAKYNFTDIKLSHCHAKVQVIRNEQWGVVIMGSANFTINPRWEAGVVCCDKNVADEFAKGIDEAMKKIKDA